MSKTFGGAKWGKIFGGPKDDVVLSIVALPDGGFAVAGRTASKGAGKMDAWVLRLGDVSAKQAVK